MSETKRITQDEAAQLMELSKAKIDADAIAKATAKATAEAKRYRLQARQAQEAQAAAEADAAKAKEDAKAEAKENMERLAAAQLDILTTAITAANEKALGHHLNSNALDREILAQWVNGIELRWPILLQDVEHSGFDRYRKPFPQTAAEFAAQYAEADARERRNILGRLTGTLSSLYPHMRKKWGTAGRSADIANNMIPTTRPPRSTAITAALKRFRNDYYW